MVDVNTILAELRAGRAASLERVGEAIERWADALDEDFVVAASKLFKKLQDLDRQQGERERAKLH